MCSSCSLSAGATRRRSSRLIAPIVTVATGVATAAFTLAAVVGGRGRTDAAASKSLSLASSRDVVTGRAIDLRNRRALVEVWSAACPPCERQARALARFAVGHPDTLLVAVDVQDAKPQALSVARR